MTSIRGKVVPIRVWIEPKTIKNCQIVSWCKRFLDHAHKTEFWYLLEFFFKISENNPCLFYVGVSPQIFLEGKR